MAQSVKIGKAVLDYTHYSGEDLYSDGVIEDQLLYIVENTPQSEYQRVIEESGSWPLLYHLSPLRGNVVEWLPISKDSKVLEIGAGCGAITSMLAEKAGQTVCVELSERRSKINACRNKDKDNLRIHLGNFKDIEPDLPGDFDMILLIGVFEYSCLYIGSEDPYGEMLCIMLKHLKPDGQLVIAIENRLGLKYWAGCTEDHLGTFFDGIEGYPQGGSARTFSRKGLEKIFAAGKIGEYSFYYPYPDYKFMTVLYSDRRLPLKGELTDNIRNFDRDRMVLFNEKNAFDSIIEDGMFPDFANSYVAVIGKAPATAYVKYSNDRAPEYRIRTEISGGDKPLVRKTALLPQAEPHVRRMAKTYQALCKQYGGSSLAINRCRLGEDGKSCEFDYLKGRTLSEWMDRCLEDGDRKGFDKLFDRFMEYLDIGQSEAGTNYDFIFSNIIISDGGQWNLIDYEWILEKEASPAELAFRAVYCYLLEEEKREQIGLDSILNKIGVTYAEAEQYKQNEKEFQRMVTGQRRSMGEIRATCGTRLIDPQIPVRQYLDKILERRVQVYFDRGEGFREADSRYIPDVYVSETGVVLGLELDSDVGALRLDPADAACMVMIKQLAWNGMPIALQKKYVTANGAKLAEGCYLFATADPNITIRRPDGLKPAGTDRPAGNRLDVELEIIRLPEELAAKIADAGKASRLRRFTREL